MNTETTIIGLVLLALFIIPYLFFSGHNKGKKKKLLTLLSTFAEKNHGKLSQHEQFDDIIMGLDENTGMAFFASKRRGNEIPQAVHLREFRQCKVIHSGISHKGQPGTDGTGLLFIPIRKENPEIFFLFNDSTEYQPSMARDQFLDKWAALLNKRIV